MLDTKKFQRTRENFVCQHCGYSVVGNGYTNHCSQCLWSKHVDINPGDRQETCQGLMEPMMVEMKQGEYYLTHRCQICGFVRKNKVNPQDNFDQVIALSGQIK